MDQKEYRKEWVKKNHDKVINYFRVYRSRNREKIRTWDKNYQNKNIDEFKRKRHELYLKNKEKWGEEGRERQQGYKRFIIDTLGGKCVCCGELELGFLTLEHIHKDGGEHRATKKNIYCDVIRQGIPKDRYTVLCMNCNHATRYNKICPHKIMKMEVIG